jgi:hypothetical protein
MIAIVELLDLNISLIYTCMGFWKGWKNLSTNIDVNYFVHGLLSFDLV